MEKIRAILQDYHTLRTSRKPTPWPYGYTNVYENIQHDLLLMNFIETRVEPLEAALAEYIASPPLTFLQEWLEYGMNTLRSGIHEEVRADMKQNWPLFFEAAEWEGYEISYEKTKQTAETIRRACHRYEYDDPEILALHANKSCDCVYMCSYCEQMAEAWKTKMTRTHTHPNNVFLHPEHQAPFIKKWIAAHPASSFPWPPTKVYHQTLRYGPYPSTCITEFAEMCLYVKDSRKKYKQGGKTPLQCYDELCRDLTFLFWGLRVTDSDLTLFMKLWNQLEIVPIWIRYDRRRCCEILAML